MLEPYGDVVSTRILRHQVSLIYNPLYLGIVKSDKRLNFVAFQDLLLFFESPIWPPVLVSEIYLQIENLDVFFLE